MLDRIGAFLTNRLQFVRFNNKIYSMAFVPFVVHQDSANDPLLFLININSLVPQIYLSISLFVMMLLMIAPFIATPLTNLILLILKRILNQQLTGAMLG